MKYPLWKGYNKWVKLAICILLGVLLYLAIAKVAIAKVFSMPELQEALDIIHR